MAEQDLIVLALALWITPGALMVAALVSGVAHVELPDNMSALEFAFLTIVWAPVVIVLMAVWAIIDMAFGGDR